MMKKLKSFQGAKTQTTEFSLVVLFFVIGFCSESIDVKEKMRFESILRMLIRLGLAAVFVQVIAGAAAYKAIH